VTHGDTSPAFGIVEENRNYCDLHGPWHHGGTVPLPILATTGLQVFCDKPWPKRHGIMAYKQRCYG
jgi:hypothetical protein